MRLTSYEDERFWSKVAFGDGCWEWQGSRNRERVINGRRLLSYGTVGRQQRGHRAHRWAWRLVHGPVPSGLCVLHRCDNPACVRPSHLFLGTVSDNNRDAFAKGRVPRARGERHQEAKLTEKDVVELRRDYRPLAKGELKRICSRYGISSSLYYAVVKRRVWRHLP